VVPESSPATGELLDGRYLLDSRIGVGGMGVVYRAHDETLGRTVAVKIFRESAADATRTTSETRLLAALNHSSLVTLFDAKTGEDRPNYLVMEYVDGPTLRERISEGPLPREEVAVMARDLAEALHVVHTAGVVHRDLKPSNILLRRSHVPGEQYRAKLADFGIAYLIDSTRLTTPGTLIGTAAYLSPEQVKGAEPATASDIYALGLVLLEALTGDRAFPQTGTHEAALARLTRDPDVPGSHGYAWKSLLTAMTARDPAERPTALEVVLASAHVNDAAAEEAEVMTGMLPVTSATALPGSATIPTTTMPMAVLPVPVPSSAPMAQPSVRRWQLLVGVVSLVVVAVIVGLFIWWLGASAPAGAPQLPALDDPLGTHMQELLEAVTP
jgi:serine/threonine protein kinase